MAQNKNRDSNQIQKKVTFEHFLAWSQSKQSDVFGRWCLAVSVEFWRALVSFGVMVICPVSGFGAVDDIINGSK